MTRRKYTSKQNEVLQITKDVFVQVYADKFQSLANQKMIRQFLAKLQMRHIEFIKLCI